MPQRKSRIIKLGNLTIGGDAPVSIQSMTNTPTSDVVKTLAQINELAAAGCQAIRMSVDNVVDVKALREICANSPISTIADIQFSLESAIAALDAGVNAVRVNPGICGNGDDLKKIAMAVLKHNAVIRVGANSGSIEPSKIAAKQKCGLSRNDAIGEALADAALAQCEALEKFGVKAIKVAIKASNVVTTVTANRRFAAKTDYPLHLGITEAGTPANGIIKSAIGIGSLLLDGIGDTIRVSLTANPLEEVAVAEKILASCGLRDIGPAIVSCPGCGRTEIDLEGLAAKVELLIAELKNKNLRIKLNKIAVMGCPVNGPGEAREADLGIAGSRTGDVIIFSAGKVVGAFDFNSGWEYFRDELLKHTEKN